MKSRPLRIVAIALAALLLLLIAAAAAVTLLFDPNDYKPQITAAVEKATGRKLEIAGDIELSLFPWLGVELGEVTLANAKGFGPQPFMRLAHAKVKVKLLPLFSKQVEVDTVVIEGLAVSLEIAADGRDNWSDLAGGGESGARSTATTTAPQSSGEKPGALALPAALAVGGLDVRDARLRWHDAAAGRDFGIEHADLKSSAIRLPRPVDLRLDFDLDSAAPALKGHVEFASRITPDLAREVVKLDDLSLGTRLQGKDLPGGNLEAKLSGSATADLAHGTAKVQSFKLSALGLEASGDVQTEFGGTEPRMATSLLVAEFDPRKLFAALAISAPRTTDPKVLARARAKLKLSASTRAVQIKDLEARLDDTTLRASASVENFAAARIRFDIDVDTIDADRYLPPEVPSKAASPAAAAEAGALNLPIETLRALKVDGALRVGKLRSAGLTATEVRATVRAKDGLIDLAPLSAKLYGGGYKGAIQIDARGEQPAFSADEALTGIQAAPLVKDLMGKDLIAGTADVTIKVHSRGEDVDHLVRTLNGNAAFAFRDGAVKGLNIAALLREATARIDNQPPPKNEQLDTDFSDLHGTIAFANGVAQNNDLSANSPSLRVAGQGKADLVRREVDYRLRVKIVDTSVGQGGAGLDAIKGVEIPVRVSGALTAPAVKVDSAALTAALRERARAQVKKEVEKEKAKAAEDLRQREDETKKRLEEKVKDRLKGLFK
jgi:AsmA protein